MANSKERKSGVRQEAAHQTILENDIALLNQLLGEDALSSDESASAPREAGNKTDVENDFAAELEAAFDMQPRRKTEVEVFIYDESEWPSIDENAEVSKTSQIKIPGQSESSNASSTAGKKAAKTQQNATLPLKQPPAAAEKSAFSPKPSKEIQLQPNAAQPAKPAFPPKPSSEISLQANGGQAGKPAFPPKPSKEIPLQPNAAKPAFPPKPSKEIPLQPNAAKPAFPPKPSKEIQLQPNGAQPAKPAFPPKPSKEIQLFGDKSSKEIQLFGDKSSKEIQLLADKPQQSQPGASDSGAQKAGNPPSGQRPPAPPKASSEMNPRQPGRQNSEANPSPADSGKPPRTTTGSVKPPRTPTGTEQQPQMRDDAKPPRTPTGTEQQPQMRGDAKHPELDIELPPEWLSGKAGKDAEETLFSSPQLLPEHAETAQQPVNPVNNNVDLEKNENLPDALDDIISGYDDEIRHAKTRDGARECTIQLAIARILEHTGHEKLAYVRYLKALEANHFSRTAIHELRRIARAYNKTKDVVTLLQSDIDTGISAEEQAVLLEECGLILFFSTNRQPENAIRMLYRAVALAPKSPSPVYTLFYMLLFEKRYDECCEMLDKLLLLTDNPTIQAHCHIIRADIMNSQASGTTVGLDHYLQALELQPGALYPFAHAIPLLIRQELWQTVYTQCLNYAAQSKDKAVNHAAYILAGSISSDLLSDMGASNQAYEQAIKANPSDSLALELMIENYSSDSAQWEALEDALCKLNNSTTVPKERMEIALMRALNLSLKGNDTAAAIDVLKAAFDEGVKERLLYEYYRMLLQKEGRIHEIMQVSKVLAEQAPPEDAAAKFADMGCYCYDVLQKYDEAEKNFRCALSFDPAQRIAFDYLEQILRARNDFEGLAQIYRTRLSVVQDAKIRASLLCTLATLCEYSLGQPENAIIYYKQYREIYPDDIHAIHNIARLSTRTKDWKTVIEMLLLEKDATSSPAERCNLLLRIANLCRYKLNKTNYAINFLLQAKEENPNSPAVFKDLQDILHAEKRWKELIAVYSEQLSIQKKATDRILILANMGHIYENMICDNNSAVACYERILNLDPDNMAARTQLLNIYRRTKNLAAFYELSLEHAKYIQLPQSRARHLYKVALKTLTLFQDTEQAIVILESALANQPSYTPAVFLLSMLYATTGRADTLVEVLRNYTNATKTQSTKSATSFIISYLLFWSFRRRDEAIHPLELSLALTPDNISARTMLIFAQFQRGQFGEIASLLSEGAQFLNDRKYAIHNYNMASFLAHTFASTTSGALENELSSLRAALALDPDDLIANERLESMEPSRVNLVPFLEKRLKTASQDDRTEIQLAIVESIFPEQPQKAFSMVCDIVNENTSHLPAIRVASNLAQKLNNPTLLCKFFAMQAQNLENIAMQVIAWTDAAQIARDKLNQPDLAIEYFKQAFMLAPHRMDLTDQLVSLLLQKHDRSAVDNMMTIHMRSISKENQVMRYQQMAEYYLKDFNEPAQAATKLRQALEIDPSNQELQWQLANLEISRQHWNEAAEVLNHMLESIPEETKLKSQARSLLVDLCIEQFHDTHRAMPLLQFILSQNPEDITAIQRLADVYFAESRLSESLDLLLKLKTRVEPPNNLPILLQIADIYRTLNDQDKLTAAIRDAARVAQLDPESLNNMQNWFKRFNDPSTMLAFIEKLVETDDSLPIETRVSIFEFAASCYDGPLHMRFEADKYAIQAATLAPNSFRAQVLAANVFDHKEALMHAQMAVQLSPLSPEPYRAMLNIANNIADIDLQARMEQQLVALATKIEVTPDLQDRYKQRYPGPEIMLDEATLMSLAPSDFNPHIQYLLKLAGPRAQIFALPAVDSEPLSSNPQIASLVNTIAASFGLANPDVRLSNLNSFVYTIAPESASTLIFSVPTLKAASEAERRFIIASALTHVKLGTLPLVLLPHENIAMLLTGLLGLVDSKLANADVLKRIQSFLPSAAKKAVIECITLNGIESFTCDPIRLQRAAHILDICIGHLFSADLSASIAGMFRSRKPNVAVPATPQQCMLNYPNLPLITSLFAFHASELFEDFRQRIGIFLRE